MHHIARAQPAVSICFYYYYVVVLDILKLSKTFLLLGLSFSSFKLTLIGSFGKQTRLGFGYTNVHNRTEAILRLISGFISRIFIAPLPVCIASAILFLPNNLILHPLSINHHL
jgi:hypothetical protein